MSRGFGKRTSSAEARTHFQRLNGTTEVVPFPVKVQINIRIKINVKGVGQECPTHTGKVKVGSKINIKGVLRRDWKSRPFKGRRN